MVRMLVTRPEPDASDTAARLRALDIEPVVEPLLRCEVLNTTLPDPAGFAGLALTSANALRALHDRGELHHFRDLPVFAVGDRTAEAAKKHGFAQVRSAGGDIDALTALLASAGVGGPLFYPAAREQSGDLAKLLAAHGVMVISAAVYRMVPVEALSEPTRRALAGHAIDAALLYSRRTAETFVRLCADHADRTRLAILCLSEAVAAPLLDAHFVRVGLADHPSEEAMMALALSFARDQNPA